jgi:hypothetical protein
VKTKSVEEAAPESAPSCPTCKSTDPKVCRSDCYDLWHRIEYAHLRRHHELSDDDIERASPDELRDAYRELRAHHIAETTALMSRRDDLTRRRDDQLIKSNEQMAASQKLIEEAARIINHDEAAMDQLGSENARLSEIVDFMQNRYSPLGGRGCALCVYVDGRFIRSCALHRWDDVTAKVLASRAADPEDPTAIDHLSNEELAAWAESVGLYQEQLEHSYLRLIVDELRDRRDAEVLFAEIDRQFQEVDCRTCDDEGADNCEEHQSIVRQWRSARAALCDLVRIHRSYLLSLTAPDGGDPQ